MELSFRDKRFSSAQILDFYLGTNAKYFSAGLRALSEVGVTFFIAGSERMRNVKGMSTD